MADPRHAKLDRWKRRNYDFGTGSVPSVTTVNKMMYSWNLENWKIRRAVDHTLSTVMRAHKVVHVHSAPNDKGERHYSPIVNQVIKAINEPTRAATKGVGVHEALESWFANGTLPAEVQPDEMPYIEQAIKWAEAVNPKPIFLEPETHNATLGYAGSDDWIMEIDGETVLGDYKTGGVFESAAMQLAAYKNCEWLYPKVDEPCGLTIGDPLGCQCPRIPMPRIDRLAVLDLKPDKWEMVYVTDEAEEIAWNAFKGCLALNRLKQQKVIYAPAGATAAKENAA